jgi:hypothetical protein
MYLRKFVTKDNFVRVYITVLNGLLLLTPREIDVFTIIVKLDLAWQPKMDGDLKHLMSTDNRRLVMKHANISKANLTRAVKKFLSVGILEVTSDGRYIIPELMKPIITSDNKIKINFVLDLNKPINE